MVDPGLITGGRARILAGHFARDQAYRNKRRHGTNDWLLLATIDGGGFAATGSYRVTLPRGHLACFKPNTPQDYGTDADHETWDFLCSHFDPRATWPQWLGWPEPHAGLLHLHINDEDLLDAVLGALHAMHHDAMSPFATGEELALNALERSLLMAHLANPRAKGDGSLDPRVRRALAFIGNHTHRPLSLARLAAHCDCSESRLSHLFRDQVGMSPVRYHERQRLRRAADLLRATPLSITEVAEEVGFEDAFYFSTRFRKQFGVSPRGFRRDA